MASKKRVQNPRKQVDKVRKEIRSIKQPVYNLNRKIKNASSVYYARKYKKQKSEYLASVSSRLDELASKRKELVGRIKQYDSLIKEKKSEQRKVYDIEKKIRDAVDNQDLKAAEKLRYELLKHLGNIDSLREKLGVQLDKTDIKDFAAEDQDGGAGYQIDMKSPYAIWEAIKQLHTDLDSEAFDFFVINGKRFSSDNSIQITAEASAFWISSKRKTDGTPYINRYINFKTNSVKYLYFQS